MLSPVFAVFTCFPDAEVPVGFFPAVPVDVSFESLDSLFLLSSRSDTPSDTHHHLHEAHNY